MACEKWEEWKKKSRPDEPEKAWIDQNTSLYNNCEEEKNKKKQVKIDEHQKKKERAWLL